MYRIFYPILLCFISFISLHAQFRLNVDGNARITGRLELWPTTTDTTSLVIGKGAGLSADFSSERSNTFIGNRAGRVNASGNNNTFLGAQSGNSNRFGYGNTFLGSLSGNHNTGGNDNVFLGFLAGFNNRSASFNTMLGTIAGFSNTSGEGNIFLGYGAGYSNTSGNSNVALGMDALKNNSDISDLVALGDSTLFHNGTGATQDFHSQANIAIGSNAGYSNTIGWNNTYLGFDAGRNTTEGANNTFLGAMAGQENTTGGANTFLGVRSGYANIDGVQNTFVGGWAGTDNVSGGHNAFFGHQAGSNNTSGSANTYIGSSNGTFIEGGSGNTFLGYGNASGVDTSNYNILIGAWSTVYSKLEYATAIGTSIVANASEKTIIGRNQPGVVIGGYANWSNLSDGRFKEEVKEDVPGMDFIRRLRPVTYWINLEKLQRHITAQMPDTTAQRYLPDSEAMADAKREIRTGFVAQEVEAAAKRIGYSFDGVNAPKNPTDNYSIAYGQFVPSLVKAAQEQEEKIESLTRDNEHLNQRVDELEELVRKLLDQNPESETTQTQTIQLRKEPQLLQNRPNPFSSETIIAYYVPEGITKAQLRISAPDGKVLRMVDISGRGAGQTILQTQGLPAGAYAYTLILDGEIVDSRQMVLQR